MSWSRAPFASWSTISLLSMPQWLGTQQKQTHVPLPLWAHAAATQRTQMMCCHWGPCCNHQEDTDAVLSLGPMLQPHRGHRCCVVTEAHAAATQRTQMMCCHWGPCCNYQEDKDSVLSLGPMMQPPRGHRCCIVTEVCTPPPKGDLPRGHRCWFNWTSLMFTLQQMLCCLWGPCCSYPEETDAVLSLRPKLQPTRWQDAVATEAHAAT